MINFHYAKGDDLYFSYTLLCEKEGNYLRTVHINSIEFDGCLWNIGFSISLCKGITFNRRRLKSFILSNNTNPSFDGTEENNLQSYIIIFNALSYFSKLEFLTIDCNFFLNHTIKNIPKSFYNFLSQCFSLKEINFSRLIFYKHMNFQSFKGLIRLESFHIERSHCHLDCFQTFYINNFPNLKNLYLIKNSVIQYCNKFILKQVPTTSEICIRFPEYLALEIATDLDAFENFILKELIRIKTIPIKYLEVNFEIAFKAEFIYSFIKFLKSSKIQFLGLTKILNPKKFDCPEFYDFLKNSKYLQGLKLCSLWKDQFKMKLILQGLTFNQSTKILYLDNMNLSHFSTDLINFISLNSIITTLVLIDDFFTIDLSFVEVVLKNKTLLYLIFKSIKFREKLF